MGRDPMQWWIGQVTDPVKGEWGDALEKTRDADPDKKDIYSHRCRVRIIGYHGCEDDLPDKDLPLAHVLLPPNTTTTGACGETMEYQGGEVVVGFFFDGADAQQPVIFGTLFRQHFIEDQIKQADYNAKKQTCFKPWTPPEVTSNLNKNQVALGSVKKNFVTNNAEKNVAHNQKEEATNGKFDNATACQDNEVSKISNTKKEFTKKAQKLHAGAGSRKPGHTLPREAALDRADERAANDPGFGADSDTTVKMMTFLEGMEDNFKGRKGFKDLTSGTDDPTLRAMMKEINDPFNAAYTIEGVDYINLFGGSNRGKRYKGSKDIVAAKDITIKIALGTSDQNALARKADSSRTRREDPKGSGIYKDLPKTTYDGELDVGLDSFFYNLQRHLLKKFKKADQQASLSIRELARRGVFASVAKNMKTASGMPDMRFKVNKRILAEAQQKFAKKTGRGKKNLQRGSTKIKKQQTEKLKPLTKGAGVAGAAIGANMIRNRVGSNPLALESILEKALPKVVASKMTAPALVYRTGRFAESAQIEDVMMGPRGGMHIDYTYARDPYETFEPGNRQGSTYRDPRKIIGSSVREIAQSIVGQKFIKIRRT